MSWHEQINSNPPQNHDHQEAIRLDVPQSYHNSVCLSPHPPASPAPPIVIFNLPNPRSKISKETQQLANSLPLQLTARYGIGISFIHSFIRDSIHIVSTGRNPKTGRMNAILQRKQEICFQQNYTTQWTVTNWIRRGATSTRLRNEIVIFNTPMTDYRNDTLGTQMSNQPEIKANTTCKKPKYQTILPQTSRASGMLTNIHSPVILEVI